MTNPTLDDASPRRRVVLLGASNLTRGVARAVRIASGLWDEPIDFFLAHGHGRSYGMPSSVLGRTLPGIVRCGLWEALSAAPAAPTHALLTDIGNDIFYGATLESISGWIEACLDRLATAEVEIVISRLPLASAKTLSPAWFATIRRVIFPTRSISLREVLDQGAAVDRRIVELAAARGLATVAPPAAWYGLDPIHIRRRKISAAWRMYFSHWSGATTTQREGLSPALWLRIRTRLPEDVRYLGVRLHGRQPCVRLRGGGTVAMY